MKRHARIMGIITAALGIVLLVFDPKTAVNGAKQGLNECIDVLIPSLFPFFVITSYLNSTLLGTHVPGLKKLSRYLRIPHGSESLLLLGLIGGYPVGAQLIAEAYNQKQIDKKTAHIMLGYCNNAGPAFIFSLGTCLFSSFETIFLLWFIIIVSAILSGVLLPKPQQTIIHLQRDVNSATLSKALRKSIINIAQICGWVILFKVMLTYFNKWFTPFSDMQILILVSGFCELSNGCFELLNVDSEVQRFLLCAVFFASGGLCICMQTSSVTQKLGLGYYIPGKLMQSSIALLLATLVNVGHFRFWAIPLIFLPLIAVLGIYKICCRNQTQNNV